MPSYLLYQIQEKDTQRWVWWQH